VGDLVEIGQFTEADRDQLLTLTLARNQHEVTQGPVLLSTEHVEFDTCSMKTDVQVHWAVETISKDQDRKR
jgi:hypothetical protein